MQKLKNSVLEEHQNSHHTDVFTVCIYEKKVRTQAVIQLTTVCTIVLRGAGTSL